MLSKVYSIAGVRLILNSAVFSVNKCQRRHSADMFANGRKAFSNGEESEEIPCLVKGTIPTWLSGEILRNGPGEVELGGDTFDHYFDGHALLHKFTIANGSVTYRSKFLNSQVFKHNRENNRLLYGSFGHASHPDPCKNIFSRLFTQATVSPPQDACNVNIATLGSEQYAITDAGHAYRIDPKTLETKNKIELGKLINLPVTTAHPHYDANGDYYNIGAVFGRNPVYCVVKVPAEKFSEEDPLQCLTVCAKIPIEDRFKPTYHHSFGLTRNYVAFHDQFVRINLIKILSSRLNWKSFLSTLEEDHSRPSIFHVIDKQSGEEVPIKYVADAKFAFHFINCHEVEDQGKQFLVLDFIGAKKAFIGTNYWNVKKLKANEIKHLDDIPIQAYRYLLPLSLKDFSIGQAITCSGYDASAKLQEDGSVFLEPEILSCNVKGNIELPRINYAHNGLKYRYFYTICAEVNFPSEQLVKVDVETKQPTVWKEPNCVPSEPVFVARPGATAEDDGIILSTVISDEPGKPAFLVILDATNMKELARAEVERAISFPLHGMFRHQL